MSTANMPVVILCGGLGTRMKEETDFRPKPMVMVGDKPLLHHIMDIYAGYGFRDFILPLGYKGGMIKDYFLNYDIVHSDIKIHSIFSIKNVEYISRRTLDFDVSFIETGLDTQTASRLRMVKDLLPETFMLTYGDGLCDVDIKKLLEFHKSKGKLVTVTGVREPDRFGDIHHKDGFVVKYNEKNRKDKGLINGGFFVMEKKFIDFIDDGPDCKLELTPLSRLVEFGELAVYEHNGRWKCADMAREIDELNDLWSKGDAFWIKKP